MALSFNSPVEKNNKELASAIAAVGRVLLGKEHQIRLAFCCLLAKGHVLIEDLPGVGKTTLAQALVKVTGLDFQRIQFTSDLLPSDILGFSIFHREKNGFAFKPGPVFTQCLLVDEINRASPKTQSALLEAMAEGQVTIEGRTRALPTPFFVIATQNPLFQSGTFPLPESQLDRFLMSITMGYPDAKSEREILVGGDPRRQLEALPSVLDQAQLEVLQAQVQTVAARDTVISYLQRLVEFSRNDSELQLGLSTRGALAVLDCAKAWAMLNGREHVLPEDIQAVFIPVAAHRLQAASGDLAGQQAIGQGLTGHTRQREALAQHVLDSVAVVV